MRSTLFAGSLSHPSHFHRTNHSSKIVIVRLPDSNRVVGDEPSKAMQTILLLAERDGQRKHVGDLPGFLTPVEHHRLFEKPVPIFLKQLPDTNGFLDGIETVGIRKQRHGIPKGFSNQWDDPFGASR